MKKRIIVFLCTLAIIMSLGAVPAFASVESDGASFDFTLGVGSDPAPSDVAYKNDTTNADVFPNGFVQGIAYFRVRDANRVQVSSLASLNDVYHFSLTYNSGQAYPGNKYLYCQNSVTSSGGLWLFGTWYP